jgi:hypothetical protein
MFLENQTVGVADFVPVRPRLEARYDAEKRSQAINAIGFILSLATICVAPLSSLSSGQAGLALTIAGAAWLAFSARLARNKRLLLLLEKKIMRCDEQAPLKGELVEDPTSTASRAVFATVVREAATPKALPAPPRKTTYYAQKKAPKGTVLNLSV